MASEINRASPLLEFLAASVNPEASGASKELGVRLFERAFLGHINLRGDTSDEAFLRGVETALGISVPLEANTVVEGPQVTALWLGPNEWLLLTPPDQQHRTATSLGSSLSNVLAAVTDVSGGQTIINIQGPQAREVLGKGCTLDLHPRVFGPGRCAQTNLAKATAIVRQLDESPSFDLIVRRSFADYLARWLADAAQEYGLAVETPGI